MIYVVTGVYRSGTSMMMQCLEAAGIEVMYDPDMDQNERWRCDRAYHPNPKGFYETNSTRFDEDFYQNHDGKAVKVLWKQLKKLPEGEYRVIFMTRDPGEIWDSMAKFGTYTRFSGAEIVLLYDKILPAMLEKLREKFEVVEINYNKVLEAPIEEFKKLWGIDPQKLAQAVDTNLYRSYAVTD